MYKKNRCIYILAASILATVSLSCAKENPFKTFAVQINDYSLTAREFDELFLESNAAADTPEGRAEFLDRLINRKLLLQEGQCRGLDKKKDFLKAIENFWEQSLLKIVIDNKIKEISKDITVTEEEVKASYDRWVKENPGEVKPLQEMRDNIAANLLRAKQSQALNAWVDGLKKKARIKIDKHTIGIK